MEVATEVPAQQQHIRQQRYARLTEMTIVDAVMGTGKTTWVIDQVKQNTHEKFIIVVPFLPEVERYANALKEYRAIFAPMDIDQEDPDIDSKTKAFTAAVQDGVSTIITTHAMLGLWDDECFQNIACHGYTLILDEAVDLVAGAHITQDDYAMLLSSGYIKEEKFDDDRANLKYITSTSKTAEYVGEFGKFVNQAVRRNLIKIDDAKYVQTIKPESMDSFSKCYVLTYLFLRSQLHCWLQLYGFVFLHKELTRDENSDELILIDHPGTYSGRKFTDLITLIEEPKLNSIGNSGRCKAVPFSNMWIKGLSSDKVDQLVNNLNTVARRRTQAFIQETDGDIPIHPANYFMWSVKNEFRDKIEKGLRYKRVPDGPLATFNEDRDEDKKVDGDCFVAHNQKATNKYSHKACLAYLTTPFPLVPIENFFERCGLCLDKKTFMLSTLVQWVWRSRIRDNERILLYIPSEPLREIFKHWLQEA